MLYYTTLVRLPLAAWNGRRSSSAAEHGEPLSAPPAHSPALVQTMLGGGETVISSFAEGEGFTLRLGGGCVHCSEMGGLVC